MKKLTTRAMALGMSVSLLMAGCMTAYADTTDTAESGSANAGATEDSSDSGTTTTNKTFTITAPTGSHKYEIYQIFTGDYFGKADSDGNVKDEDKVLSNIKWGANGSGTKGTDVEETVLNALTAVANATDKEKLAVITRYANITGDSKTDPVATITDGGTYKAPAGYYLIKDVDGSVTGTDAYTTYIVKVVGDFTIEPKSNVPSFDKKLKDTNDSTGETSGWQDSADYDIGDMIPFKLEGTVASNYADYTTYYFAFHDKEETDDEEKPRLKFDPDTVKVYVVNGVGDAETEVELDKSNYTLVTDKDQMSETNPKEKCTFEVVFEDLKKIDSVQAGSKIRVEYKSQLTDKAVLGNEGNLNQGKLEFSNNPNNEQGGEHGETPWDNVIVFTYQVVVNKYKNSVAEGNKLTGAEFTLKKKINGSDDKIIDVIKSEDGTSFTFKGLDDGDYILSETKTPDGYNTIADITFKVKADHTIEWDGDNRTGVLTSLTGDDGKLDGETGKITFTADDDKSDLSTDVINKAGVTLPSTGGVGTTMFYAIGGVLMAGAGILLVTRKRMEESEK